MRRYGFTLIEAFVLVAVAAVMAAVLFPIFARHREPRRHSCQSNLKQIGLCFRQYLSDYDQKYPLRSSTGSAYGWADAIYPYVRSTQIFQCYSDQHPASQDPKSSGYTDFWLNHRMAGLAEKIWVSYANTILCGEGNDGSDVTDARYSKSLLPSDWLTDETKPSFRHLDGANYLFVDGHVKWLKPGQVTTARSNAKSYTLAVK